MSKGISANSMEWCGSSQGDLGDLGGACTLKGDMMLSKVIQM